MTAPTASAVAAPADLDLGGELGSSFTLSADGGRFDFHLQRSPGATRLFVLLNGAIDRDRRPLPVFSRWTWHERFPGHVLNVNDPTLYLDEGLRLAWYLGDHRSDWSDTLARLVADIADRLAVAHRDIVFYGSSGGGFAAIVLATRLAEAGAIAINPQTHVLGYHPRLVQAMLDVCFPGTTIAEFPENVGERRLSATRACTGAPATRVLVAQNPRDTFHHERHFAPFCATLGIPLAGGSARDQVRAALLFDGPGGHGGAEPPELVPRLLAHYDRLLGPIEWAPAVDIRAVFLSSSPDPVADVAALEERGFVAHGRPELDPWPLQLPIDWAADPFHDRNWAFQLHAWRMVDLYLLAHAKTRRPRYLRHAMAIVIDWARWHLRQGNTATASWSDMTAGLRAQKLAYLISLAAAGDLPPSPAVQRHLCALWETHADYLADSRNLRYTNHSLPDLHGLRALARVWPAHPRAPSLLRFAETEMARVWASQFDEHGVHRENSPAYHSFAVGLLGRYLRSGWYEPGHGLEALLERARAVERWMRLPDGRPIPVGDGNGAPERHGSTPAGVADDQLAGFETFCRSGYGVVRSPFGGPPETASLLHFMGAYATRVHKHADDLSVVWHESGRDVLVDAGKYGYHSDRFRRYVVHTRAHNTVEIDGRSYGRGSRDVHDGAVRRVERHAWGFTLDGVREHAQFGVVHARCLLWRPGAWLVIADRLSAACEHDYTAWLHLAPRLVMERRGHGFAEAEADVGLHVAAAASAEPELVRVRGQTEPHVQGWLSQGYREVSENDAIGVTVRGADVAIVTALSLGGERLPEPRAATADDPGHVTLWAHGERYEIVPAADGSAEVRRG